MARRVQPWLWWALGGAVVLAFTQRKTIMVYGQKALDAGMEWAFDASLPGRARPYAEVIRRVAREKGIDPFLLFALGDRESLWGEALDPRGPAGTGDYGHGRGLMQIDDRSHGAWLASNDWTDPYTNVSKGAEIYLGALTGIMSAPSGSWRIDAATAQKLGLPGAAGVVPALSVPADLAGQAALSAYNAGTAAVRRAYSFAVANGLDPLATIDRATTGKDYSSDVWDRMLAAADAFTRATGLA